MIKPGKRRPVLLTVDDNRSIHEVYALAFEQDYDHLRAHGGKEALEIVRRQADGTWRCLMVAQTMKLPFAGAICSEPIGTKGSPIGPT